MVAAGLTREKTMFWRMRIKCLSTPGRTKRYKLVYTITLPTPKLKLRFWVKSTCKTTVTEGFTHEKRWCAGRNENKMSFHVGMHEEIQSSIKNKRCNNDLYHSSEEGSGAELTDWQLTASTDLSFTAPAHCRLRLFFTPNTADSRLLFPYNTADSRHPSHPTRQTSLRIARTHTHTHNTTQYTLCNLWTSPAFLVFLPLRTDRNYSPWTRTIQVNRWLRDYVHEPAEKTGCRESWKVAEWLSLWTYSPQARGSILRCLNDAWSHTLLPMQILIMQVDRWVCGRNLG